MMKESLISVLLYSMTALISCSNDYFRYNPLNDEYRLEQNKKRMEIEYKITKSRGNGIHGKRALIFLYMEDGFYEYMGYDKHTKLNYVNKYKRYYRKKIDGMIFNNAISTEIIKKNLPLDKFIQLYLIETNNNNSRYYRIKNYVQREQILLGGRIYDDNIDEIALAAQYCYDFLIVIFDESSFHDLRLYLPNEYFDSRSL